MFAVRDEEAALDIVQDAMMRLAESYGDRPAEELPLLFQRILQNAIRDWFRRQKVRSHVDDAGLRARCRGAARTTIGSAGNFGRRPASPTARSRRRTALEQVATY